MKVERYYKITMNGSDWMLPEREYIEFLTNLQDMRKEESRALGIDDNKLKKQFLEIKKQQRERNNGL